MCQQLSKDFFLSLLLSFMILSDPELQKEEDRGKRDP